MVKIMIVDDHSLMRRAVREVIEQEGDLSVVAEACNGFEAEELAAQILPDVILMDLDMPGCDGFEATERVLSCSPKSCVVIFAASHQEQFVFQALQRGAMGYITKDIEPEALVHAIRCAARNDLCIPGSLASQMVAHLRNYWQTREHSWQTSPEMSHALVDSGISALHEPGYYWPSTMMSISSSGAIAYRTPRRSAQTSHATLAEQQATSPGPSVRPLTGREREILDLMRRGRKNREIAGELCIAESTVHKHVQNIFEKLHARNRTEAIYLTSAGR